MIDELFIESKSDRELSNDAPLAARMRPRRIDEFVGQEHLVGEDAPIRSLIENGSPASIILWGPPGTGKTTLAEIIANACDAIFVRISAVEAGVKEVRQFIANAKIQLKRNKRTILFVDEIHRFANNQQDALLHAVESGVISLIGATTENPSFEVNPALLSRCQVYHLLELDYHHIEKIITNAIENDTHLKVKNITLSDIDFLIKIAGGDARNALNALELAVKMSRNQTEIEITRQTIEKALQKKTNKYDKKGENHYDTISAFIKSMRGSDPDAALFWLAKMLEGGEDPKFIARRMVIFASEDLGNAEPAALMLAVSVFNAVQLIGMPECRINLAQGVTYLASAPKSNASYMAIEAAISDIRKGANLTVPMHLRNAPTKLMKEEGYGDGYIYPHDEPNHFVDAQYFPTDKQEKVYYVPSDFGKEKIFKERLNNLWKKRRG